MRKCYYCRNFVESEDDNNFIYFCSKYCLETCTRTLILFNKISKYDHVVTNKLCYKCYKPIHKEQTTFHFKDNIFCSKECRNFKDENIRF